jgi:8-oxo-dGTP pyrophosphatase MutT (NUDIX family)
VSGGRRSEGEQLASREVFRGKTVKLDVDRVRLPNGKEMDFEMIRHAGAAAVVPVATDGTVLLIRQYRYATGGYLLEIPAGKLDAGEAPQVCAVRELAEETGVTAQRWTNLGLYIPAPGIFTEIIHLFLARDLEVGTPAPDADEELEIEWLPMADATARVLHGELNDGKTALALWRAQYHLQM